MSFKTAKAKRTKIIVAISISATILILGIGYLLFTIIQHQFESKTPYYKVVEINDTIDDPSVWGKNFPLQYDDYKKTVDQTRTRFGGSEAIGREPTDKDPRKVVAQSKIAEDPRLVKMWSGYAFAKDFREERGHAFMLTDQEYTERQQVVKQPGTCINCHASTYTAMMRLGNGDLTKGFEALNTRPYPEARKEVTHPVSCVDCHNPSDMSLRVTRPAFMEGIAAYKASQGVKDYDVNKMATRQEMRSFVCGQCHVEYHFKGPEKRLTFPWNNGLKADEILEYYAKSGFKDWVHKDTGAEVLKAQHPEFELWNQGTHAAAGVSCVDCHMPYKKQGSMKITDHHVRSPLLNINRACQSCHHVKEEELLKRVETIQTRHISMRDSALNALMQLIDDIKKENEIHPDSDAVKAARVFQRKAQFLIDFVEAENSSGFHAPQEAARLMTLSLDYTRQGQLVLFKK